MWAAQEATWTRKNAITVHAMRCLDNDTAKQRDKIDHLVASENRDDGPQRLIRRARLVVNEECGPDSDQQCGHTMLTAALVVASVVGILFIYFGGLPGTPLKVSDGNKVSVVPFVLFAVLQIASFVFSAVLMIAGIITDGLLKNRGDSSLVWGLWRQLQPLGWIQSVIGWVKLRVRSTTGSRTVRPIPYDALMEYQAKWLSLMIALMTHCLWTLVATALSLTILVMLLSNQYTFTWHDSLLSTAWKHRVVTTLGKPLSRIVEVPDRNDISWVLGERMESHNPRGEPSDIEKLAEHDRRARWGWFLLAIVFVYAVPPRFLLFCLSWYLARRANRELKPNLDDAYYRVTLKFCDPHTTQVTTEVQPKPVRADAVNLASVPAVVTTALSSPDPPKPVVPLPNFPLSGGCGPDLVILSYEVFPSENLLNVLPIPGDYRARSFGDVDGAIGRKKMLDRLIQELTPQTVVILVVSAAGTADAAFNGFFASVRRLVVSTTGLLVLLTHIDRMREMWPGDVEQIRGQLKHWHRACALAERTYEFDHLMATQRSRDELAKQLRSFLCSKSEDSGQPQRLIVAGHFSIAAGYVRDAASHALLRTEANAWRDESVAICHRLRELYDRETALLDDCASRLRGDVSRLVDGVKDSNELKAIIAQTPSMSSMFETSQMVCQILANVPGRWGVGGAVAGLCAGAAAGAAVLAVAPAAVAIPLILSQLPGLAGLTVAGCGAGAALPVAWKKLFRATGAVPASQPLRDSEPMSDLNLDDFVRSAILFALVLELQGNTGSEIASRINAIVSDVPPDFIGTLAQVEQVLDEISGRVDDLSK